MPFDEPPDDGDNTDLLWTRCEDCGDDFVTEDDDVTLCATCRAQRDAWTDAQAHRVTPRQGAA